MKLHSNFADLRYPIWGAFIFFILILLYFFCASTISISYYTIGEIFYNKKQYDSSILFMNKSYGFLPFKKVEILSNDRVQRIRTHLGIAYFEKAKESDELLEFYVTMKDAAGHFETALVKSPFCFTAACGLARSTASLEYAFSRLFPEKKNMHDALPFFKRALNLGPNDVLLNYRYLHYLDTKKLKIRLIQVVTHLTKIQPSIYYKLKNTSFYSPGVRNAVKNGLLAAIDGPNISREAYIAMADLLKEEGNIDTAAIYLKKGIKINTHQNSYRTFLKFGEVLLSAGKTKDSFVQFLTAVNMSSDPSFCLKTIFNIFQKEKKYSEFLKFAYFLNQKSDIKTNIEIYIAKARIELDLMDLAKAGLINMISDGSNSTVFYLLAVIAEKQMDWDAMELYIQKASVLDSGQCRYYHLLGKALKKQKKFHQAAIQIKKAKICYNETKKQTH